MEDRFTWSMDQSEIDGFMDKSDRVIALETNILGLPDFIIIQRRK